MLLWIHPNSYKTKVYAIILGHFHMGFHMLVLLYSVVISEIMRVPRG